MSECLFAKLPNGNLNRSEFEFLGHIVSVDGLRVDSKKIKAVQEWQTNQLMSHRFVPSLVLQTISAGL
jgi:hypothetical protein